MYICNKEVVTVKGIFVEGQKYSDSQVKGFEKFFTEVKEVEVKGGLIKINPILDWTELDIWRYLAMNQIPVNPLYSQGYRSLGCAPCSKIVADDELERAGRWQDTTKCGGECGIHTQQLK